MKKVIFMFSLLSLLTFASCSGDDGPIAGQESVSFDIPFNIFVAANAMTSTPSDPRIKQLTSVLSSANQDKAKFVYASSISRRNSYISISGLTEGGTLSNITFSSSDSPKTINFPLPVRAVSRDTILEDDAYTDLVKQICDYLASKKSIELSVTYTAGDKNISNGVIKLHASTTFSWK